MKYVELSFIDGVIVIKLEKQEKRYWCNMEAKIVEVEL